MLDLFTGDSGSTSAAPTAATADGAQKLSSNCKAVLRPYRKQSVTVTSIIAVGDVRLRAGDSASAGDQISAGTNDEALLTLLSSDPSGGFARVDRIKLPPAQSGTDTFGTLKRRARQLSNAGPSGQLLLLSAQMLERMITPLPEDFGFRAVAILAPRRRGGDGNPSVWRLQRILFDFGLIGIGHVQLGTTEARCFVASDQVRSLRDLDVGTRGNVTMSTLGSNGAFANQLFQYAYLKLYALRHGLTAAVPAWQGGWVYSLDDPPCAGLDFPELRYEAFTDCDRRLWERHDPLIDINLWGYFQETPECWRPHRPFLRRLFQLPVAHQHAIEAWRCDVTNGGQRALVAVHLRRGDYRNLCGLPWFRMVPVTWYVTWLRTIWPTLRDPVLFVATDEPAAVLPAFAEFGPVRPDMPGPIEALGSHIRDFEVLRRADVLAICNSSFSRLAAILAHNSQQCFRPSFEAQCFVPYEPWIDPGFWARFAETDRSQHSPEAARRNAQQREQLPIPTVFAEHPGTVDVESATSGHPIVYFDVTDLVIYLRQDTTPTGIQRVHFEIIRNLVDVAGKQPIHFTIFDDQAIEVIETSILLDAIEQMRSGNSSKVSLDAKLGPLSKHKFPVSIRPQDLFFTIGAFWGAACAGRVFQQLKNTGARIGIFIHDIISITDPEYFETSETRLFVKGLVEALAFADFIVTNSEYTKVSLISHMAARNLLQLPVEVVRLAHELSTPQAGVRISDAVARITNSEYVLCVGTIEVRKNHAYLFHIWKTLVRSGRANVPTLVIAGRRGWLVDDFMAQLRAANYLDGKVIVLHDASDVELALLYRQCLLTMYPSFAEGWGLPVGESLAHGKVTIASGAGAIPEVGGGLVDYIDPYNVRDGLQLLLRYLDDSELRRRREHEIAEHFAPRPWHKVAEDFLAAACILADQTEPPEKIAAITLPPNQYLPISNDVRLMSLPGLDGELSADLACVCGWRAPEGWGVRADGSEATLRFRPEASAGTNIHLLMQLVGFGGYPRRIRICSGSGAEIVVSLGGGSDRVAVLSCEVEPGNLVTVLMSTEGHSPANGAAAPYWGLKGILYIWPERVVNGAPATATDSRSDPGIQPATPPTRPQARKRDPSPTQRVPLRIAPAMDDSRRATSLDEFLQSADTFWPCGCATAREPPILVDDGDKALFYNAYGQNIGLVDDQVSLVRRSDQYVSMSRFSEGSIFDRSGVSRALGYLERYPPAAWLSKEADGTWISERAFHAAPRYDKSYLVFFNGNLQNYYHWIVEAVLSLDVLEQAIGPDQNVKIALPKSMDVNAVFDHRASLSAVGLDRYKIIEVADDLIRADEAIWLENDLVQSMPAPFLQDFQRRVAAMYATSVGPRRRRLFVARRGPTRMIHNLAQVQARLSTFGFETVYLEGMSVRDQILLFQSADFVIGSHGAGLANLLFCQPETKVIELTPTVEMRPFFWLISQKLGLVYGVQFCDPAEDQGFQASISVDVDKLDALYRIVDAH